MPSPSVSFSFGSGGGGALPGLHFSFGLLSKAACAFSSAILASLRAGKYSPA